MPFPLPSFLPLPVQLQTARRRTLQLLALAAVLLMTAPARAQTVQVQDASALHPPTGARVAIVEFDDLQCPACAAANPTLKAAADKYHIPWIRHDFLIPLHNWSRFAAIDARWFDAKSTALGAEYRDQIFANQTSIYNPGSLAQFTQKFAQSHSLDLPFAIDPQGKLVAEVEADNNLSRRTGITGTPTIFIVTSGSKGRPFIQVENPQTQLYSIIDQAISDTAAPSKPALKPVTTRKPTNK